MKAAKAKNWIKGAIKRPGALRKKLGAKPGKPIAAKKLRAATHSKNPRTRKQAVLAESLKKMHRKKR